MDVGSNLHYNVGRRGETDDSRDQTDIRDKVQKVFILNILQRKFLYILYFNSKYEYDLPKYELAKNYGHDRKRKRNWLVIKIIKKSNIKVFQLDYGVLSVVFNLV